MGKIVAFILDHKKSVAALYTVIVLACLITMQFVNVNYDMSLYLPEDEGTREAIVLMKKEFGYPESSQVLVENVSVVHALEIKEVLSGINGVKTVTWLDNVTDVRIPVNAMDERFLDLYYKDGNALFDVEFWYNGFSNVSKSAVNEIRQKLEGETFSMSGDVVASKAAMDTADSAIIKSSLIAVVIVLVLLTLATSSWLAPILFLGTIGVAILINAGTNFTLGSVSNITRSIQALLQLAVSIDYSLFLFHRYEEERKNGLDPKAAVIKATSYSATAIAASCLTTVAGFAALCLMRYSIGKDMGLALLKGVVFSLICVLTLLPLLIYVFNKQIDKFSHRTFVPKFDKLGNFSIKLRTVVVPLVIVLAVPLFFAQKDNKFLYGESGILGSGKSQYSIEKSRIDELYGENMRMIVMVPGGEPGRENMLITELGSKPYVKELMTLSTIADPYMSRSVMPESAVSNFQSEKYIRMVLTTTLEDENPQNYRYISDLRETLSNYYEDESYSAGKMSTFYDIKTMVEKDYVIVNFVSIAAVMLIMLISFRNILIPVFLTAAIEFSIFINMAVPYFQGTPLSFIGYMIVSAVQLGATIDYAILLCDRYVEFRNSKSKFEAAISAVSQAGPAIFISALIFGAAGISLYLFSDSTSVQEIGLLIGRGALISGGIVLVVVPQFLVLFDKPIRKLSLGRKKGEGLQ